ncbi:hypothetical protein [Mycolicibacterium goodii]|uniref:Secreted protein n=1 Tax=Mycolicibacterium goodii TaxID=134601 RepID=A0ABS6HTS0_MYCGD|nr:hypothetical protein [Mycolicibacterium goodii]OKH66626.1 hypothetical protein EB74_04020 [Mycobacterium sp. SWH-M5]MBU8811489.1 hypothetical protein [Mycolicibacterium goodii]MBU8826078.1 hypothetical protein [Mycolicibacterium goodii]MBU8831968.1 hypothetical protein [Mycolicibacterium goodii]MBU8839398.1 hypothetical protein [Mycolicibacterium goodii]
MRAEGRIAAFGIGLVAVFAAAFGVGSMWAGAAAEPGSGYTLELADGSVAPGTAVPLRFRIVDESGAAVSDYDENHEKDLHLIVVGHDLTGYQHLHPTLDGTGTWSVPLDVPRGGDYRVFADFVPAGGSGVVAEADLRVTGSHEPQPLPAPSRTATVDGYTVTLSGSPVAHGGSQLDISVSRDGERVGDLQPYLGAHGHLVALRASDLSYLHVHPTGDTPADIAFHTEFPSAGDYRLYFDFKHNDVVRTAEFTVSVPDGPPGDDPGHGDGHSH